MKRYDINPDSVPGVVGAYADAPCLDIEESEDGDWVKYEDVVDYLPYPGDQALAGEDMPPMATILDLIKYCTSVHDRFGNTCVTVSLQWGGTALNVRDKYKRLLNEACEVIQVIAKGVGEDGDLIDRKLMANGFLMYMSEEVPLDITIEHIKEEPDDG